MKRVKMILGKVMDPAPRLNRTTLGKLNLILQIFEVCAQYLTYPGQTADYENLIFLNPQWSRSRCSKVQDNLLQALLQEGETG